jgi:SAM-dependent methyltransferase
LIKEKTPLGKELPDSLADLESGHYSLLSDRPLFALFRFAARQSKHGRQRVYDDSDSDEDEEEEEGDNGPQSHDEDNDLSGDPGSFPSSSELCNSELPADMDVNTLFLDPTLPLVLDLGCGYGVSLLGLSYTHIQEPSSLKYNYLGCDMSARAMNFANGISQRWGMQAQCVFIVSDIVRGLEMFQKYSGCIHWVSINFPTPYRQSMIPDVMQNYSLLANNTEDGVSSTSELSSSAVQCNSQLPSLISDFMVTSEVYQLLETLVTPSLTSNRQQKAFLYLQSNVQDVAIVMNGMLHAYWRQQQASGVIKHLSILSETDASFESEMGDDDTSSLALALPSKKRQKLEDVAPHLPTKRQLYWSETEGGKITLTGFVNDLSTKTVTLKESAEFWLEKSPLPSLAKTETEVMCKYKNKAVYRQLFSFSSSCQHTVL